MKRFLCILLTVCCLLSLLGCSSPSLDPVLFYYCRKPDTYQYFQADGIIAGENRDLSGHSRDLQYLISLYLAGPLEEDLVNPFPRKTRLVEQALLGNRLMMELSDVGSSLTDAEFSLACACLAKTCMEYISCQSVTIQSGARSITINAENVILFDSAIPETTEGE